MTSKWSCGKWRTLAKADVTNSAKTITKTVASVEKPVNLQLLLVKGHVSDNYLGYVVLL